MKTAAQPEEVVLETISALHIEERKIKPVKWWAWVGAFFVALQAWIYLQWIISGNAKPTPLGPDDPPHAMKVAINVHMAAVSVGVVIFLYYCVYRPWRRQGHMPLDGLLSIAMALIYWQDPLVNLDGYFYTYNSYILNWGSWSANIPFFNAQHGNRFAEPIVFGIPVYILLILGIAMIANGVMGKAKARWPNLGTFGLLAVAFGFFCVMDVIIEPFWLLIGYYTYPSAIKGWTLFYGHYYQFPVYEIVIFAGSWTAYAALRYFRDDKGRTLVERGIDQVRAKPWQKTTLRCLAIVGVCNVILIVTYMIPTWELGQRTGEYPKDFLERSYFLNGLCGVGTDYACPGPNVPNAKPHSVHLGPNGELIVPAGTHLPCHSPTEAATRPSPGCGK